MDKIRQAPFALIEVCYGVAVPRMLREETTEVLVAGAGPVGMITAILLADEGIRVKVVDKESGTATHSYSCALHPASLQLLAEMGFAEEILNLGRQVDTVGFYDGQRRRAEIKLSGFAGDFPFVLVLPQSALEEVLENRLARRHHIKVDWNRRLSTLHFEGGTILATVDKLVATAQGYSVPDLQWVVGKTLRIRAGFVIGADGHHSHVRMAATPGNKGGAEVVDSNRPVDQRAWCADTAVSPSFRRTPEAVV